MKTIYNAEGTEKTLDAVDAKEHIATGRWFWEPQEQKQPTFEEQMFSDEAHAPVIEENAPATDESRGKGRPKKQVI